MNRPALNDEDLYRLARRRVGAKIGLGIHAAAYLVVNLMLWMIDRRTGGLGWSVAPLLGTPVAAMDTGGTREILEDGRSGLIVRDADGLAAAIARLVDDAALRERLKSGALARAAAFSAEALVPHYEAVYKGLA